MLIWSDKIARLNADRLCGLSNVRVRYEPDFKPVRLKSHGRRARYVGNFASIKAGRSLPWESGAERIGLERAEVDPHRIDFRAQPFRLSWYNGHRQISYTPDRLDLNSNGELECVEVKSDRQALWKPEMVEKLGLVRGLLHAVDVGFKVEFASELVRSSGADFVARVLHHRRTVLEPSDHAILDGLTSGFTSGFPFGALCEAYGDEPTAFAKLSGWLVRRRVATTICSDFCEATLIEPICREVTGV
ncbi:hypothetical protein [Maricaulis sp.]|uniref:hypothetical protein n=1 Tax=Maricaulis sp. TaxID=1486257 RepID=UPI00329767E7